MSDAKRERAGALIALFVILLYIFTVFILVRDTYCSVNVESARCLVSSYFGLNEKIISFHTMIAGLVSALAVAQFAVTKTGDGPAAGVKSDNPGKIVTAWFTFIVYFYLFVWAAVGVTALVIHLVVPDANEIISGLGTTWFGTAIAAASVYLGINPSSNGT